MEPKIPQAIDACHELIAWLVMKLDQFPRARRYTLGQQIETTALRVLEALLFAADASRGEKLAHLRVSVGPIRFGRNAEPNSRARMQRRTAGRATDGRTSLFELRLIDGRLAVAGDSE